jgi:DNA polymerase III subunit epsilon
MYLFFDTETTGLPRDWRSPVTNLDNWPRLVQIAWLLYDNKGNELHNQNYIIKPNGFEIPEGASRVHGITTEIALKEGVELATALKDFSETLNQARLLIAHNMDFDEKIIGAELLRTGINSDIFDIAKFCTMKTTINFCRIERENGYKYPSLAELHFKLFNNHFDNAHDALADVTACANCFFELKRRGIFS